jgi:hypothetical protein
MIITASQPIVDQPRTLAAPELSMAKMAAPTPDSATHRRPGPDVCRTWQTLKSLDRAEQTRPLLD